MESFQTKFYRHPETDKNSSDKDSNSSVCILKDFSTSVQCFDKNKKCNTRFEEFKEKLFDSNIVSENIQEISKLKAVQNLSNGLSFDKCVIDERTPYVGSYKYRDIKNLATDIDKSRNSKKLISHSSCYNKRHMPCHLTPIKQQHDTIIQSPKKSVSEESFWLGANGDEKLMRIPHSDDMIHKTSPDKIVKKPVSESRESYGWEEHVLSLISKSTADVIVKDYTYQNQNKLKTFLEKANKSKTIEQAPVIGETERVLSAKDVGVIPKKDGSSVESMDCLSVNVNKVKQPPKEFKVVLQQSYPLPPNEWTHDFTERTNNLKKGLQKWSDYPKEIKEEGLKLQELSHEHFVTHKPQEIDLKIASKQRSNFTLLVAVDEWRSKWLLEKKWQTKSLKELKEAMKSINDHVRLAAVSAAGKAILDRREDKSVDGDIRIQNEDEVVKEIETLFNDRSSYVCIAAAAALFSVDRADQQATNLLLDTVQKGAKSERWIAAQCLAQYNHHDDCVIIELLNNIQNGADPVKRKRIEVFLERLSGLTDSIQYMLSERLNSTSWKDRVMACQLFPVLSGKLKKDVSNKLSYLTWHDWNKEVRMAAAKALGRTGNGKLVHDSLCKYLKSTKVTQQVESLRKISSLGIITAQLMVPFLQCLVSSHVTVCMEALRVIRVLHLCTGEVIEILLKLLSCNTCLKIKHHVIKTLGIVGIKEDNGIRDRLLWSMRFEKERSLRQASCEAIQSLRICDSEVVSTMQDMLVVEDDERFREVLSSTLASLGFDKTCDEGMITAVQERVKTLCVKDNILLHVLTEDDQDLLTMYMDLQQLKQENDTGLASVASNCHDNNDNGNIDDGESDIDDQHGDTVALTSRKTGARAFDSTLEGYRARQISRPNVEFPDIRPSYIPFWTESQQSFQDNDDENE